MRTEALIAYLVKGNIKSRTRIIVVDVIFSASSQHVVNVSVSENRVPNILVLHTSTCDPSVHDNFTIECNYFSIGILLLAIMV